MLLGALRACAALTRGLSGFSAPPGHEQGESFIGGFLNRTPTGKDGVAPFRLDPDFHGNPALITLLLTVSAYTLPRLFGGCELGSLWAAAAASFFRCSRMCVAGHYRH